MLVSDTRSYCPVQKNLGIEAAGPLHRPVMRFQDGTGCSVGELGNKARIRRIGRMYGVFIVFWEEKSGANVCCTFVAGFPLTLFK